MLAVLMIVMLSVSVPTAGSAPRAAERLAGSGATELASRASGEPTYPMICRGGAGSALIFSTADTRSSPSGEKTVTYELTFTPSLQPAGPGARGLSPGQCSWLDRAIGADEPYLIRFDTPYRAQPNGAADNSSTAAERYPDASSIPNYLRDPEHYYRFSVYNSRKGYFVATSSRFYRPARVQDGIRVNRPPRIGFH